MLANLMIATGILGGILTLLDIFLSKAQKEAIQRASIKAWDILDELKTLAFLDWLQARRHRFWVRAAVIILAAWGIAWLIIPVALDPEDSKYVGPLFYISVPLILLLMFACAMWATLRLMGYVLRQTDSRSRLIRSVAVGGVVVLLASLTQSEWLRAGRDLSMSGDYWYVRVLVTTLSIVMLFTVMLLVGSIFLIYLTRALLFFGEWLVRAIAQHEKGPLLALSAAVTAIGAIVKAISSAV